MYTQTTHMNKHETANFQSSLSMHCCSDLPNQMYVGSECTCLSVANNMRMYTFVRVHVYKGSIGSSCCWCCWCLTTR